MKSLFVAHLGPVQGFIASARRSRDLYGGSWILSELSKAAALVVAQRHGLESLVFPCPQAVTALQAGSDLIVANKIVALIDGSPAELGRQVQEAVLGRLQDLRNAAFGHIQGAFERIAAERQVNDLVECFWVGQPLANAGDYALARRQAEAIMAARKATRDFGPVTWGANVPKSSLDGQRESVIPETAFDQVRRGQLSAGDLRRRYGVGSGERLCGVGLLKRHLNGAMQGAFYSTSHVAALPLLQRIAPADREAAKAYTERLVELGVADDALPRVSGKSHPAWDRYDGQLLFSERLGEYLADPDALAQARQALQTFLKKAAGGRTPQPYYALLAADGDRMGRVIDNQTAVGDHRELSRALSGFELSVPGTIADHQGSLVYAGGDDVLAFVPLHTVLSCARKLADGFCSALAPFRDADGNSATLSVGIAVGHHLDPLSDALEVARQAERIAKASPGKNALAITVAKRSGVPNTVAGAWGAIDKRLEHLVRLHRLDAVPDGAAYELREMAKSLAVAEERADHRTLHKAMAVEAIRILRRKRALHGAEAMAESTFAYLEGVLDQIPVEQLADELVAARVFADAADVANLQVVEEGIDANLDH